MFQVLSDLQKKSSAGQVVLVRGDLNVPIVNGVVSDTTRLERLAPTLNALSQMGLKVAVLSHFGRPKGQKNPEMSLQIVADSLGKVLGRDVAFCSDCVGQDVESTLTSLDRGGIAVLENVRFYEGEENNDIEFAKRLGQYAQYYVNDAFSVSHRAHASTHAIATILPAYAGLNMQAELEALSSALDTPERPVMAIVGGAKVSSKLDVLVHLVKQVDTLVIGGGMANTFLYAKGISVGASLCETDLAQKARDIMASAEQNGCQIILPTDACVSDNITNSEGAKYVSIHEVSDMDMILDIGSQSTQTVIEHISNCKTLIWNGPLGAFEFPPFEKATMAVCAHVVKQTQSSGLISVGGGGDTVSALAMANAKDKVSYVSTAGGAFLEWMEGKELPGVAVLYPF